MTKYVVLGGGISGLAAAQALKRHGVAGLVLEQCPHLGGLTRTTQVGDFCFDYTGHFLHLSRFATPAAIPGAHQNDDDWMRVDRRSYFLADGKLITAPIQYNLGELPEPIRSECVKSYEGRATTVDRVASFRDYMVSGFGCVLADRYLIPLNEKTMAVRLDTLSHAAVRRFFPKPDDGRIRAGLGQNSERPAEYNSTFWYPKQGGIVRLVEGLSVGLDNVQLGAEAATLDLSSRCLITTNGRRFEWDVLLPSVPMKTLCELTNDPELRHAAAQLTHSSTISMNFGVRGALPQQLLDAHWIYVPDPSIPFYRFGCYSNISQGMCTRGHSAVYVEAAVPGDDLDSVDIAGDLQPKAIAALERLGWLRSADIVCSVTHVIRCAYVHHTPARDRLVEEIHRRLREHGVYPIGRYGLWDYTGMEDSLYSAFTTVEDVVG